MSDLFSSILSGATTEFHVAEQAIEDTWAKATAAFPELKSLEAGAVKELKQLASDAFSIVDTDLAPRYADAVSMAESAADTLVMALTHGQAAPGLPWLNLGLTKGFDLLRAALAHAEIDAKAKYGLPPPDADATAVITQLLTTADPAAKPVIQRLAAAAGIAVPQ